jgi:hypothetical protein
MTGHDREAVEAIGQIDCVARPDDHAIGHGNEADRTERVSDLFEERHDEFGLCRQVRGIRDVAGGRNADHRLPEKLHSRRQALWISLDDFAPVINPSDRAERECHPDDDPDQPVL